MAFPTIEGSPGVLEESSSTTSHPVPYPTVSGGILADDLLLILCAYDGTTTISNWNGFTERKVLTDGTGTTTLLAGYKRATGGESGTVTITSSLSERGAWHMICARGAHTTSAPEVSTGASGNSTNADPDSVTASWGAEDNLFIAVAGLDQSSGAVPTVAPTNYGGLATAFATSGGGLGYATRNLAAATDDPGAFTSVTEQWCGFTIVIRPSAAAVAATPRLLSLAGIGR